MLSVMIKFHFIKTMDLNAKQRKPHTPQSIICSTFLNIYVFVTLPKRPDLPPFPPTRGAGSDSVTDHRREVPHDQIITVHAAYRAYTHIMPKRHSLYQMDLPLCIQPVLDPFKGVSCQYPVCSSSK